MHIKYTHLKNTLSNLKNCLSVDVLSVPGPIGQSWLRFAEKRSISSWSYNANVTKKHFYKMITFAGSLPNQLWIRECVSADTT